MPSYYPLSHHAVEQEAELIESQCKHANRKRDAQLYDFRGGLNVPGLYQSSQHESYRKEHSCRDQIAYTFRPYACRAPGLYQPRMTVNVPHTVWDDDCYIQQKARLDQQMYNYSNNLNRYRRLGVEIPPTAGVGIRADRTPALYPGQLRSEAFMKGRGKGLNHCPGDSPNLSPDMQDKLHSRRRKDSGLYPAQSTTRRGYIATKELNPVDRIGLSAKGPPVAGYAAMWQREGFLVDQYQEAIDAQERINEALWCDTPSYY